MDISTATVTKVADGLYRLATADASVEVAAKSKDDATAKATAWKIGEAKTAKVAEIDAALKASDLWAVRHAEDGISLTDARKKYRAQLRTLRGEAAVSDDPASISVPAAPPFP